MHMIQAIIFDLDGTLVDSEMLFVRALQGSLAVYEKSLSQDQLVQIVYGRSRENITREVLRIFSDIPLDKESLSDAIDVIYESLLETEDVVIVSSVEMLKQCAAKWPTCIVSGSSRQHIKHFAQLLGVSDLLKFYIGAEDYPDGKPNPTCFQMAAEKLNVDVAHCVVFEDSNAGVRAAKAAGMYCVALQRPSAPQQDVSMADCIVANLLDCNLASVHG